MKRYLLSHRMSQLLRQLPVVVLLLSLVAAAGGTWTRPALATSHLFANSGQILGGETGNGVALGDLDGDGDLDAYVANDFTTFGEANQVWFNEGDGTFTAGQTMGSADGHDVALGDLDGDGDLDAVVVGDPPTPLLTARVWLNVGGAQGGVEGTFDGGPTFGSFTAYGVALGDVDGDSDLDALLVGNSNQVWLNGGNGIFSAGPALPFLFSGDAELADLDGDGWLDALIADSGSGTSSRVWWNDGNWGPGPGSFTAGDILPAGGLVNGAAVGNLNGDNRPDIFLAGSGPDQIYWNEGERDFSTDGPLTTSDNSWDVVLGDVDGDADLDAVVANITGDPNRVWRNDGGRAFTVDQEFGDEIGLYWSRALGLGDLNGDGAPDLFEVTTAEDRVWLNQSATVVVPNEPGWQMQLVDARGDAGYSPSLALDANGYPHISYGRLHQGQDDTYSYLTYARWDGVRWHDEFVANSVSQTALALDAGGRAQIAFTNGRSNMLQLARWDGTAWQVQTVESAPFPQTLALGGLALDAAGHAYIVYNTFSNTSGEPELLRLARWDGASWQVQTVENGLTYDSAVAVDSAGDVHLSYAIREAFDTYVVKYAVWNGTDWQTEILDGEVPDAGVFVTSLALDDSGSPAIAYALDAFQGNDQLKVAALNGASWQIETVSTLGADEEIADISLDVDGDGDPHLVAFRSNPTDRLHWIDYVYRDGATWETEILDSGDETTTFRDHLVGMALDGAGALHAATYAPGYEDLRYVTWAPNWQSRTLPENGAVETPDIGVRSGMPAIGYYRPGSGQVKLATWEEPWSLNPLAFVSDPVTDLGTAVGAQHEHLSYYDADNGRLIYAYWDGSGWRREVVDEAGDVGRTNDLVLAGHGDGAPWIAYWDATTRRVKLARPVLGSVRWDVFPNDAGPALGPEGGPLSLAITTGGVGVSYYDGDNGDLRYAFWRSATQSWSDERVDGAAGDAGRLNSMKADWSEGVPVVAYYDETEDAIRLAYRSGSGWQMQTAVDEAGGVTSLSLELPMDSRRHARIAYSTASGALNVAVLSNDVWRIEVVESGAGEVAMAHDTRLHLAYSRAAGGLRYAFQSATLTVNSNNPAAPPSRLPGEYNPLDPCPEHPAERAEPSAGLAGARGIALPFTAQAQGGSLDDQGIFAGMMAVFRASAGGRQYINLYHEHGPEMGRIGLDDPLLLWDALGTLQNFFPGLEALVTGRGDEVVVTQEMVDDALSVWQRLAAAGSPALANTIDEELAKYDDLQAFVGLTFDEWALAIGVQPPGTVHYLPVIAR